MGLSWIGIFDWVGGVGGFLGGEGGNRKGKREGYKRGCFEERWIIQGGGGGAGRG